MNLLRYIFEEKQMIRLTDGGAYLINGTELVEDNNEARAKVTSLTGSAPDKEQAKKETMA